MTIAIVDNDPQQRALLTAALGAAGHTCVVCAKEEAALIELSNAGLALLVFHWQPEVEGLHWLESIRPALKNLPILLVTSRATELEFFIAQQEVPCDYLVKPLRRTEIALRTRLLIARANPGLPAATSQDYGAFTFDPPAARLTRAGQVLRLTQKEFDLALLLFKNLGRPLSRATILEAVWPNDTEQASRSLDTHISRVRAKLDLRPEQGYRLAPVYSYGYRLERIADSGASEGL